MSAFDYADGFAAGWYSRGVSEHTEDRAFDRYFSAGRDPTPKTWISCPRCKQLFKITHTCEIVVEQIRYIEFKEP